MPVFTPWDLEDIDEWLKILEKIIHKNKKNFSKKDFEDLNRCLKGLTKLVRGVLY